MDQLKRWFGERTLKAREARLRRFWQGAGRIVCSCQTSQFPYRQLGDRAAALANIGPHLKAQATLPGENVPSFYPDYTTVSAPRYWGGRVYTSSDATHVAIEPAARDIDEALTLEPGPVDDPDRVAAQGLAMYRRVCERLETDRLWYRTTGVHGPLNTASLVMKQDEFLMAMHTAPDRTHAFLSRVCDFLIRYFDYPMRETGGKISGDIWPYTWMPAEFGISFTEDLMPLLSAETYATFGLPYVRRIAEHAGGAFIHCCGDFGRHAPALATLGPLMRGIEFHYPFTRIEELQDHLPPHTVYVPMITLDRQQEFDSQGAYVEHLLTHAAPHTRWWFILDEGQPDREELIALVERHQDARATGPGCRD